MTCPVLGLPEWPLPWMDRGHFQDLQVRVPKPRTVVDDSVSRHEGVARRGLGGTVRRMAWPTANLHAPALASGLGREGKDKDPARAAAMHLR